MDSNTLSPPVFYNLIGKRVLELVPGIWGKLESLRNGLLSYGLKEEYFSAGRLENCQCNLIDIIFSNEETKNMDLRISRKHFEICKKSDAVWIKDCSRWGTWLNGKLIGQQNSCKLQDHDEISIIEEKFKIFKYIDQNFLCDKLKENYNEIKDGVLGEGMFGKVKLVARKENNKQYAVKKIKIDKIFLKYIENEIDILKSLNHHFIIKLFETEKISNTFFIVMEYVEGGDLAKYLVRHKLKESDVKFLFFQIVQAVQYLHIHKIIHRDLKLQNILIKSVKNITIIKVIDFGLSRKLEIVSTATTNCGTPYFRAPEVLKCCYYDYKVDSWSLGIILYYMLSSGLPPSFYETSNEFNALTSKELQNDISNMAGSNEVKNLIKSLLQVSPETRISSEEIEEHPWITNDSELVDKMLHTLSVLYEDQKQDLD